MPTVDADSTTTLHNDGTELMDQVSEETQSVLLSSEPVLPLEEHTNADSEPHSTSAGADTTTIPETSSSSSPPVPLAPPATVKRFSSTNISKKFLQKTSAVPPASTAATPVATTSGRKSPLQSNNTAARTPALTTTTNQSKLVSAKLTSLGNTKLNGLTNVSSGWTGHRAPAAPPSSGNLTPSTALGPVVNQTGAPSSSTLNHRVTPDGSMGAPADEPRQRSSSPHRSGTAWAAVPKEHTRLGAPQVDFPTAAEAAHGTSRSLKATPDAGKSDERSTSASRESADAFRGVHLDPNVHHWDEMEDDSNDFLGGVLEFGDGTQYSVPVRREEDTPHDADHNEPTTRQDTGTSLHGPVINSYEGGPSPKHAQSSRLSVSSGLSPAMSTRQELLKSPTSPKLEFSDHPPRPPSSLHSVGHTDRRSFHSSERERRPQGERVLFNEHSNRLEPYSGGRHYPPSGATWKREWRQDNRDADRRQPSFHRDPPPHSHLHETTDRSSNSRSQPWEAVNTSSKSYQLTVGNRTAHDHALDTQNPSHPPTHRRPPPSEASIGTRTVASTKDAPLSQRPVQDTPRDSTAAAPSGVPVVAAVAELSDYQEATMHSAAERAKRRRMEEEREREEQKERARKRALELEVKMEEAKRERERQETEKRSETIHPEMSVAKGNPPTSHPTTREPLPLLSAEVSKPRIEGRSPSNPKDLGVESHKPAESRLPEPYGSVETPARKDTPPSSKPSRSRFNDHPTSSSAVAQEPRRSEAEIWRRGLPLLKRSRSPREDGEAQRDPDHESRTPRSPLRHEHLLVDAPATAEPAHLREGSYGSTSHSTKHRRDPLISLSDTMSRIKATLMQGQEVSDDVFKEKVIAVELAASRGPDTRPETPRLFSISRLTPPSSPGPKSLVKVPARNDTFTEPIPPRQLRLANAPYMHRWDILTWNPRVPFMSRMTLSREETLFFVGKGVTPVPRVALPHGGRVPRKLVDVKSGKTKQLWPNQERKNLMEGSWRRAAKPPTEAPEQDVAGLADIDPVTRTFDPFHGGTLVPEVRLPGTTISEPQSPRAASGSKIKRAVESDVTFYRAPLAGKPVMKFTVSSELTEEGVSVNEASDSQEHSSAETSLDSKSSESQPSVQTSLLLTPPVVHPNWSKTPPKSNAPDPEHLKAVWSQAPASKRPIENSLEGIADDFPGGIPLSVQDMKSEDGDTRPAATRGGGDTPPTTQTRSSLRDAHRGFQQVPLSNRTPNVAYPDVAPRPVHPGYGHVGYGVGQHSASQGNYVYQRPFTPNPGMMWPGYAANPHVRLSPGSPAQVGGAGWLPPPQTGPSPVMAHMNAPVPFAAYGRGATNDRMGMFPYGPSPGLHVNGASPVTPQLGSPHLGSPHVYSTGGNRVMNGSTVFSGRVPPRW